MNIDQFTSTEVDRIPLPIQNPTQFLSFWGLTIPNSNSDYGEEKASSWLSHSWSLIEAMLVCPAPLTRAWKAPRSLLKLLWWRIRRRTACLSKAWGDGFRWSSLEMGATVSESFSASDSENDVWTLETMKAIINTRGSQFVWDIALQGIILFLFFFL